MLRFFLALGWLAAAAIPLAAPAQMPGWPDRYGAPQARVWLEDDRDYFRRGDRLAVHFATSEDAYVAVVHIDPDGSLEFLFPATPWDDGFLRGGRAHSLGRGGYEVGRLIRGRPGIGYLYMVASPFPLDYRAFGSGYGRGWDWSYGGGRMVRGDPFWALEQITRMLIPEWNHYAPYVVDYYSYHVEGRHRYPAYACGYAYGGHRGGGWGWGATPYYDSCDRLDPFLRQYPDYYDARLYRGDRRAFFRDYGPGIPEHGYKEPGGARRPDAREPPSARDPDARPPARGVYPGRDPAPSRAVVPQRRRPALERRGGAADTAGVGGSTRPDPRPHAPPASDRTGGDPASIR